MDPPADLPSLIEDLEVNIDELLPLLSPLLPPSTLSTTALPLPLLSKAKLHVLAAYAIESVLFSTLLASGVDAKSHPIFSELARLKKYFGKIKDAEDFHKRGEEKESRARLDVAAAGRFIKHGLSGNETYDRLRKEREQGEKERALERARAVVNKKFEEEGEGDEGVLGKRKSVEAEEKEEGDEEEEEATPAKKRGRPAKKDKLDTAAGQNDSPARSTRSSAAPKRDKSPAAGTKGKGKGKGRGRGKK